MIGLGAHGGLDDARAFQADVRVDPPLRMVFDESGDSWTDLGISVQPAAILFDAAGKELKRWFGPLDTGELTAALPAA